MTASITAEAFVERLRSLDQASLARLRDGEAGTIEHILTGVEPQQWSVYGIVASLFPLNPSAGGEGGMGAVMRQVLHRAPDAAKITVRRFAGLLDALSLDRLEHQLAYCVKRAAMEDVAIDWVRLVDDLTHWEDQPRLIAREWAREFWEGQSKEAV